MNSLCAFRRLIGPIIKPKSLNKVALEFYYYHRPAELIFVFISLGSSPNVNNKKKKNVTNLTSAISNPQSTIGKPQSTKTHTKHLRSI